MLTLLIVEKPSEILKANLSVIIKGTEDKLDDLPQNIGTVIIDSSMMNIKKSYNLFKSLNESAQVLFKFIDDDIWYTRDEAMNYAKMRMS